MPALVAFFVRQLLIIGVQLGIFSAIQKFVVPLLNSALEKIVSVFGVSEETAHDILANEIIETAEALGLTVALSKAKLPLAIAEKLGFTSKGFSKRKLSGNTEEEIARQKLATKGVVVTDAAVAQEVAVSVAKSRGFGLDTVSKFASVAVAVIGIPIGAGLLLINTIDFAAWPTSSYQDTFQRFFGFFGLKPDADAKNSKVLGEDTWKRIFAIYQTLGAIGIEDPYKEVNVPFTRENLIDLVDKIAAEMIVERGSAKLGWVIGATQGFLVMKEPVTQEKINNAFVGSAVAPADAKTGLGSISTTKVFTGIISQGVVGAGLVFEARPDDMIESAEELKQAATNNLAPFLQSLLGKIVYEVKVVASIITADGFKQTGSVQKLFNGYDALGKAKYKNVVNKFAVLDIFVFTDRKIRTKISRIVLGPVDSVKLKVGTNDLTALSVALPKEAITTDIADIKSIETVAPVVVTPPPQLVSAPTSISPDSEKGFWLVFSGSATNEIKYQRGPFATETLAWAETRDVPSKYPSSEANNLAWSVVATKPFYPVDPKWKSASAPTSASVVSSVGTGSQKLGANATTLYEWYSAHGWVIPSIQIRSTLYQNFGLGQSAYYTGTAEQNTKLLNALKAQ